LDGQGGLQLGFLISELMHRGEPNSVGMNTWQIDYIRLDVQGQTLGTSESSGP
jgi:hypothetical protein